MTTLTDYANAYQPTQQKTFNVTDLPKVATNCEIKSKTAKLKDGKDFSYMYIEVNGGEYRVPKTVIEQLQTILKFAPTLAYFKVTKTGTTKDDTKYKVEPVMGA